MKFAVCNEFYQGWSIDRICKHAARCGYDGVEIAPFTLADDPSTLTQAHAKTVATAAAASDLEVVGIHWLLAKPDGMHVTTPDAAVRRRTTTFLQHLARFCAAMGGNVMVFGSPKQRDVPDDQRYEDAFSRAVELCREVCEVAGPLGVTLAIEPLGPKETNFIQSAPEAMKLINAVDHPACRLHLDVKAMCNQGENIAQTINTHINHLAHFHANDANMRGPGFGDTDYRPIASSLKQAGYDRYVSVEVFNFDPDPETIAEQSIAYLKQAFGETGPL